MVRNQLSYLIIHINKCKSRSFLIHLLRKGGGMMRAESGYHEDCLIWESGSKRQNNCRKEMNIMKFEKPKMETVTFDAEDVIVTSGGGRPLRS